MRVLLIAVMLVPLIARASAPAATSASANTSVTALHKLFRQEWNRRMRENPLYASDLGDRRFNDKWPDMSLSAIVNRHRENMAALKLLAAIDRSALPAGEKINYDLFKWQYKDRLEGYRFHDYLFALNQLGGIQTVGDMAESLRFQTLKDYQDWLQRLQTFGTYMDQTIALLREGIREGRTEPRVVMQRIPRQIAMNIVTNPTASEFYRPFKSMPATINAQTAAGLRNAAAKAIREVVVPAFRRLQAFFKHTYLPACRTTLGASALPDGKAYYAYLARHFTTTDLSPAQIHALGLQKVKQIHAQMLAVIKQTGFKGDFAAFLHFLRTDPRFYYRKPMALLEAYRAEAKTIDPLLVKLFHKLPRIPWGVRPIPADQAPNTYPAYSYPPAADGSRAAYMYVNLYRPETRPRYEIPVLTCHEGRPGHALQLSLATELTHLPEFRRFEEFTSYTEGWALYSETLCGEIGIYKTPYEKFGALSYQMWRAVRLVVDTGIHMDGWTRQQAVDYFRSNTALSDQNINTEVDRYIAWPGQALAYMIGEIRIRQLRKQAHARLGSRFDLKAFNDKVLENGSIPLSLLSRVVDDWVLQQTAGKTATTLH